MTKHLLFWFWVNFCQYAHIFWQNSRSSAKLTHMRSFSSKLHFSSPNTNLQARHCGEFSSEKCKHLVPPSPLSSQPSHICGWQECERSSLWTFLDQFASQIYKAKTEFFLSTWLTECIRLHLTAVLHGLWLLIMDQFNAQSNQVHQHQNSNWQHCSHSMRHNVAIQSTAD